jgi:exopolysaccharide production protein ExoQ
MLVFSNMTQSGAIWQYASILISALAFILSLFVRQSSLPKFNLFEYILVALCLLSMCVSAYRGDVYSAVFSVCFLFVVFALSYLKYFFSLERFHLFLSVLYMSAVFTVVIFQFPAFVAGLSSSGEGRWATRFTPFGTHPNLAGLVFSGGAIVLFYQCLRRSPFRWVFATGSILSIAIVLSSGARAGLLAVAVSGILTFIFSIRSANSRRVVPFMGALFVTLLMGIMWWDVVTEYLVNVLELNSSTRGINSGGTGRMALWSLGWDYAFSNWRTILMGNGMRSSSPQQIGFSTESSYITILIEHGLIVGIILFVYLASTVLRLGVRYFVTGSINFAASFNLLTFVLIQSFFNRYLLGIGNIISLALLYLVNVSLSEMRRSSDRNTR